MVGRPRRLGWSRCSTEAKKASTSACRIVASVDTNTCSHRQRPRATRSGSEFPLVEVVDGPVGLALAIAEAEAFVEGARGDVVLAGAEVHVDHPPLAGELDRRLHQRPSQPLAAALGDHVELLQ